MLSYTLVYELGNTPHWDIFCHRQGLQYANIQKSQAGELQQVLTAWKADLVITSGCPLVPIQALAHVTHGGINLHPSLLPAYRGADPITWQVVDQIKNLGVSVHRLTDRYDRGDVLAQTEVARIQGASREQLFSQLEGDVGYSLVGDVVNALASGEALAARKKPAKSPTRIANRLTLHTIGNNWNLRDLAPAAVWDILRYYNQCPPQWLALTGWRKHFKWRPVKAKFGAGGDSSKASSQWSIDYKGTAIFLEHQAASIRLAASKRG